LGWEAAIPLAKAVYKFSLLQFPRFYYSVPIAVDAASNVEKSLD
jgi:hypothetical protein